jgi:ankyrin repeat protein
MSARLTPLHIAAGLGDVATVEALLNAGADPSALEPDCGASPLHLAAQGGSPQVGQVLLAAGAFLNLHTPVRGLTPLMSAVWYRNPSMVAFLLQQPGINVDLRAVTGETALDLLDPRDDDVCAIEQKRRISELFTDFARQRSAELSAQPLFTALTDLQLNEADREAAVRALLDESEPKLPVDTVSPVFSSADDGRTPLLVAAHDGNAGAVAALLAAGADQTLADAYMHAVPAHKAAYSGHAEVLRLLANAPRFDVVINAQGPFNGYTPLHDAVWHGHTACVRVLVDAGAQLDLKGHDGKTPADLAQAYGYHDCLALLRTA